MNFLTKLNQLSGKMRLAIFMSGLWFLSCFGNFVEDGEVLLGLIASIAPLFIIWGIWWIKLGYKKDKEQDIMSKDE